MSALSLPVRPRRLDAVAPAGALYVAGANASVVLGVLAELALEPAPRVYRVAGGFVIVLDVALSNRPAGVIGLRECATNLYVPIDAALSPQLLPDEVPGVTRGRGLLLLGTEALAFEPDKPLALSALLKLPAESPRAWVALPTPLARADEIRSLVYDRPEDDSLQQGGKGIGEEEPRPDQGSAAGNLKGRAEMAAGKLLSGIGRALGMKGVEGAGERLKGKAIEDAPRLSEGLLGKQEAALRDLLRKFQEGRTEEALRRALPMSEPGSRGDGVAGNAQLPFHNLAYSLSNVLGGGGGGANWYTEPDLQGALMREYRKAAENAATQGDFRRAAFIYGKLLGDWRRAAATLQQGGLHRDAAQIFLRKLNDQIAAARAYEAAGDVDEAVKLYRRTGQRVQAGDLLRRAGEEDAAVSEYHAAADDLVERGQFKAAGELMMGKVAQPERAEPYFRRGWSARPHADALPCAIHLLVVHADAAKPESVLQLTAEADRYFAPPGNDAGAGAFYSMLATLAEREALAGQREVIRDRALTGAAHKLRQGAWRSSAPGLDLRSWPPELASDAQFAVKAETRRQRSAPGGGASQGVVNTVRIAEGTVSAACFAPASGELFVGFDNGRIVRFHPLRGTLEVRNGGRPVVALSCDRGGRLLSVLHRNPDGRHDGVFYQRRAEGGYLRGQTHFADTRASGTAITGEGAELLLAMNESMVLQVYASDLLQPMIGLRLPMGALAGVRFLRAGPELALIGVNDRDLHIRPVGRDVTGEWQSMALHWQPRGMLPGAEFSLLEVAARAFEIAGRNEHGSVYWTGFELAPGAKLQRRETRVVAARGEFQCATMAGPGRIAALSPTGVSWFNKEGEAFKLVARTKLNTPRGIHLEHLPETGELLVLNADGTAHLVQM